MRIFYAVLFHELVHSSGHRTRIDRGFEEDPAPFSSSDYCKEELVAEMGSAFLAAVGGISPPTIEQSAAYIENWKKQLEGDARMVVAAGGAGQKAADWILGETFDKEAASDSNASQTPAEPPALSSQHEPC